MVLPIKFLQIKISFNSNNAVFWIEPKPLWEQSDFVQYCLQYYVISAIVTANDISRIVTFPSTDFPLIEVGKIKLC